MKYQEAGQRALALGASVRLSVTATLCVLAAVTPAQAATVWGCIGHVKMFNEVRTVNGPVNAECPGDWPPHSVPFGNWGADTQWNVAYDGFQFAGWKDEGDGWREWNSCTSTYVAPDYIWYNANNYTTQETTLGWQEVADMHMYFENTYCDAFHGAVLTVSGAFMELWELDPWDEDEYVGTLYYNQLTAGVYCSGTGPGATCGTLSGASPPSSVYPNGVASAYGSIAANGWFGYWDDGTGGPP
jgi:hypothetical protein